jgi:adenosylcobinamide kinase/adenosylcobinamide-phosphate guanylyltransferase
MGKVVLVTGGVRSGKSAFAMEHLRQAHPAALIATGKATDPEMAARIEKHKQDRPAYIKTLELNTQIDAYVKNAPGGMVLLDCLGTWVTNRMWDLGLDFDAPDKNAKNVCGTIQKEAGAVFASAAESEAEVWFVTNEVGWGLLPDNPVGRLFTDTLGRINQMAAQAAQEVYLLCSSIPMRIK